MHALSIKNLTKMYGNGVQALKGIDLEVESGDFFALLGPNGAGKTTAIGIISSLVSKTSGEVKIFGHSIDDDIEAAKSCIGLVPQELNMNLFDTVLNIVVNQAGYYGIERRTAMQQAEKYLNPSASSRSTARGCALPEGRSNRAEALRESPRPFSRGFDGRGVAQDHRA